MVQFRPRAREIIAKIVYYGPPLGGKTTNLRTLYEGYPAGTRGELVTVPAGGDRTIFFDFLPVDAGTLRGMRMRVQLYTVPGQVHYNATRQVVLRGVDAVVFVADSQRELLRSNRESWDNLKDNLALQGLSLADLPHVIQYNKRDLKDLVAVEELDETVNEYNAPFFEAVATEGIGVEETLQGVVKLVARSLRDRFKIPAEAATAELVEAPSSELVGGPPPDLGVVPPPPPPLRPARPLPPAPTFGVSAPDLPTPSAPAPVAPPPAWAAPPPPARPLVPPAQPFPPAPSTDPLLQRAVELAREADQARPPAHVFTFGTPVPAPEPLPAEPMPNDDHVFDTVEAQPAGVVTEKLPIVAEPLAAPAPEAAAFDSGPVATAVLEETPAAPEPGFEVLPELGDPFEEFAPVRAGDTADVFEPEPEPEPEPVAELEPELPPEPEAVAAKAEITGEVAAEEGAEPRIELPPETQTALIQRVIPRALAQVGEVRELELEVPVPSAWTGGKRLTLQFRLTLVPEEDPHGE